MKMNKGFKQFLAKSVLFLILFVLIQLVIIIVQDTPLPKEYYFLLDVDIGKALLLTAMIFFFLSRDRLKNLEANKFEGKTAFVVGILSLLSFVGYFVLKGFLINNPVLAIDNFWGFYSLKELTLVLGTILLFVAVFGLRFSNSFVKKFRKEIVISVIVFVLALFLIVEFQKLWIYFSFIVARIVYFLLSLTFDATLFFKGKLPNLGITDRFVVGIGEPCSGIDSMLMFIFLYIFIVGYDWKRFNKKKILTMFIPGVISVFLLNIIRIYLLITIGTFISQDFAIGIFHSSASMVFFLAYFALFWGFGYRWMKK